MYREGHIREDGMVFWRNRKDRGEVWLTQEKYEQYCLTRKNHRDKRREEYFQQRDSIPVKDRSYLGKYNPEIDKYFLGLNGSGTEIWVDKDRFDKLAQKRKEYRLKYHRKMKSLPKQSLRFGDKNPNNPSQYVTHFIGNLPRFGSYDDLQIAIVSKTRTYSKMNVKYRKIRTDVLKLIPKRLRRGDINPENGFIFWEYGRTGKPRFLPPNIYHERRNKENDRKKKSRIRNKM